MPDKQLAALRSLDPALLSDVVRESQQRPSFKVLDWDVQPLTHNKIIDTTGGLFLFRGRGEDSHGVRPWEVVLKILNNPGDEASQDPRYWAYWKRELLVFKSDMLQKLPAAITTPHCYGTIEREDGGWIWLERITESTSRPWSLQEYQRAARYAGRFAAGYLKGAPLPNAPWLSDPFFRSIFADGGWWATYMDSSSPTNAWQNPLVQQFFSETLRSRIQQVWAEKQRFWEAIDSLPQVFCHNDFHRRNLMLRTGPDGQEELVALDWAFCGPGAVGMDMGELVATSTFGFEVDPAQVEELEALVLDGYLAGLREDGWSGDPELVRLGYLISAVLWMGATLPGWAAYFFPDDASFNSQRVHGRPAEVVLAGWVSLAEFLMERADEARSLIRGLGI